MENVHQVRDGGIFQAELKIVDASRRPKIGLDKNNDSPNIIFFKSHGAVKVQKLLSYIFF